MSDVFVVRYTDRLGQSDHRTVLAADRRDAVQAHLYHHPGDAVEAVQGPVASQ
jgi:hypothetical protein